MSSREVEQAFAEFEREQDEVKHGTRRFERFVLGLFDASGFLWRLLGINTAHVRVLLQLRLRLRARRKRSGAAAISDFAFLVTCLAMMAVGGLLGFFMGLSEEPYVPITIGLSATLFFLMMILISELGELMSDRAEVDLVLPTPIEDSSVIVARLLYAAVLLGTLLACLGIGQVVFGGRGLEVGFVTWVIYYSFALVMTAAFVAFSVTLAYVIALRVVGPGRFRSTVAWIQAGFLAVIYSVIYIVPPLMDDYGGSLGEPGSAWHTLWPPCWFAALFELLGGATATWMYVQAGLALVVPPLLLVVALRMARSRFLSALAAGVADSSVKTTPPRAGLLSRWGRLVCRNPHQLAAFDWVIALMKRETTFRVRVVPSLLITAAMLAGAALRGRLPDGWHIALGVYITVLYVVVVLDAARFTDAPNGRFLFAPTPAWREHDLRVGVIKGYLSVFGVAPGVVAIAVFGWIVGPTAAMHSAIALVASLATSVMLGRVFVKRLPFSEKADGTAKPNAVIGFIAMLAAGTLVAMHMGSVEVDGLLAAYAIGAVVMLVYQLYRLERLAPVRSKELTSAS